MGQDTDLSINEIVSALRLLNIPSDTAALFQKNDRITAYLLDDKYLLRISESAMYEQTKLNKVKSLPLAPKIHSSGEIIISGRKYCYFISDFVQGNDLWSVIRTLTDGQKHIIGKEIAQFLNGLHSVTGVSYDIGHYIPAVPGCKKSWKDGHIEYAGLLKGGLSTLGLEAKSECAITKAFAFIYANIGSLEYQTGAVLLHNDFHPKNIIVRDGRLAGVIDWECSQFGEPDFELAHLFHWCAYPPIPENDLGPLLKSVAENLRITSDVPNIEARLTIYQLEHELNQLVWNGKSQESERIQRINGWLGGRVYALFEEWRNETGFRF